MKFTLHIWRQENARAKGHFETYHLDNISPDCSFLEMLDILNEQLVNDRISHPVCFDNDCREGICGMCGLYINGRPHGNDDGVTTCQLHMRKFHDGDEYPECLKKARKARRFEKAFSCRIADEVYDALETALAEAAPEAEDD